jgi:formylglycine-generating enzyme required for sulfatase activity/tRNA A-37 threonylcarbamoyl transferase component Bud32
MNTCARCGANYLGQGKLCSGCRGRPLSSSEVVAIEASRTDVEVAVGTAQLKRPSTGTVQFDRPARPLVTGEVDTRTPLPRQSESTVFLDPAEISAWPLVTGEVGTQTPMPRAKTQQRAAAGVEEHDESPGPTVPLEATDAEPETDNDPWLGKVLLGQFRIVRKLGEGGFGAAYIAEQQQLTGVSKAVVKFIREDLPDQHREMVLKRFMREVVTLEKLDNHHLPKLLGSGRIDGQMFLIMQSAGDLTLSALLKRGGLLPPARALDIAAQVCDALGEAHRWQVVHRDVKPDNILLTERPGEDRVKLIDVGIAKILDGSEIEDPNSQLSHARLVIGTPAYMSPEQALGSAELDGRSDLYSLTCVLYEMLTGKLPVQGRTNQELLRGHISKTPPTLKQAGVTLPGYFQTLLDRGLQKEPEQRFLSAAELRAALEAARARWLREQAPKSSSRKWALIVIPAAVLAAAALLAVRASGGKAAVADSSAVMDAPKGPHAAPAGFVQFKGGSFQLGRDGEDGAPDVPAHSARVGPFALAKHETRVDEYAAFAHETGAALPPGPPDAEKRFPAFPVVNVSREDAASYCSFRFPGGGRLPTEAEWEWAARSGGTRAFPYGDELRTDCINAMQGDDGHLEAVDARPCGATPEGILGLSGNAWEWTSTDAVAYPGSLFKTHPGLAVIRGGSFFQQKQEELTATHRWFVPSSANRTIGFRCAFGGAAR